MQRFDIVNELRDAAIHFSAALCYSLVGLLLFGAAFLILQKIVPFSIRKEIEEDQNTALGIVIGAVFIASAIIVAAAIQG